MVSAAHTTTTVSQNALGRAAPAGAWAVWLGTAITTVGISWDVQWHKEVGPDTFLTLPHLLLYSGSALAGIASLVMTLAVTASRRAGRPVPPSVGGPPLHVFGGAVTAPLGYLVSGIGALSFLLYGFVDLWWHSIYGFDAVLSTPSHVALFLSICVTMVGSIIVFAAAGDERWGGIGILLAIPILIVFAPITTNAFNNLALPLDPTVAGIVLFSSMLLILGAGILRRPGAAVAIVAALGVLQAFLWWFSPWAAHVYAAAVGLPLRDGLVPQPPDLPNSIPMFLVVAAGAVEAALRVIRTRGLDARRPMLAIGAVTGVIVALSLPLQQSLTDPTASFSPTDVALIAIVGLPLGVLAGFLATRFLAMLRALAPVTREVR